MDRQVTIKLTVDSSGAVRGIDQYTRKIKEAGDSSKDVGKSTSLMTEAVKGLVAAVSLREVINFASEMNALGQEANISEERFAALTSTMGGYEQAMQAMRTATMGVVDDMAIQQNAMLLINSAGIETTEELGRMTNMIMRLKKPSEDASTAIENFALMLANNSILRLDSFGLSASRVRERIIELQESGEALDRSQAFRMAVMEEGEKAMQRYGAAADAAGTSFSRLGTIVENVKQDFGQRLNTGVEASAGLLELALGIHPAQVAEAERRTAEALTSLADDFPEIFRKAMSNAGSGADANFIGAWVQNALVLAKADPALAADASAFTRELFQNMRGSGQASYGNLFTMGGFDELEKLTQGILVMQSASDGARTQAERVAEATARAAEESEKRFEAEARTERILEQQASWQDKVHSQAQELLAAQRELAGQRSSMMGGMDSLVREGISTRGGEGNPNFLTASAAGEMRDLANEAGRLYDEMLKLDEANNAAFSDDQLERAKSQSEYLEGMADSADKAAEAFKNISLSELFGQEGGGTQGEMFDAIKQDLEEMQFTAEHIAGIQRTFDLASGRQTGASAFFEDTLSDTIAGVAANISQDLAVGMLEDFDSVMKEAVLRGMDTSQPEFLDKLNETFNTIDFDPEKFNVDEFLAEFDPAAQATTTMNTEAQGFAEASAVAEGNFGRTVEHVDAINTTMATMTSKTHELKIKPVMVDIPNLIMMLLPGLAQAIQGNGGTVPGTSQRASTSGQLNDRGRDR